LNINVKEPKPVKDYIRLQGRFRHLKDPDIELIQEETNRRWDRIRKLCSS